MSAPLPAPDYSVCPCCARPLAEHDWQPWFSGTSQARGVVFHCPPEGQGSGSGAEGDGK